MMWFKLMGITLVISGFGTWGLLGAGRISKRVKELQNIRLALGFLEKEIAYNYTPLSRAMERTSKFSVKPINRIFKECAILLSTRNGITAGEAWTRAVKTTKPDLQLKAEDIALILTAAEQLGVSDIYEQRKFLTFIQEELKIQEERARLEVDSGQKLWSYGGFILGAVIVILLV